MTKISISIVTSLALALGLCSLTVVAEQVIFSMGKAKDGKFDGYVRYEKGGTAVTRFYTKGSRSKPPVHKYEVTNRDYITSVSNSEAVRMFYTLEQEFDAQKEEHQKHVKHKAKDFVVNQKAASCEISEGYHELPSMKPMEMEMGDSTPGTVPVQRTFFKILRDTCSCGTE